MGSEYREDREEKREIRIGDDGVTSKMGKEGEKK